MTFPGKGQIVNIYSFVDHMVSVTTTCAVVAPAVWKICDEWAWACSSKTLEKQTMDGRFATSCSVLCILILTAIKGSCNYYSHFVVEEIDKEW